VSVSQSVSQSVRLSRSCTLQTAGRIEVLFEGRDSWGLRNNALLDPRFTNDLKSFFRLMTV